MLISVLVRDHKEVSKTKFKPQMQVSHESSKEQYGTSVNMPNEEQETDG